MRYSAKAISPMFVATFVSAVGGIFLSRAFEENVTISSAIGLLNAPLVFVVSVLASRFVPELLEHHSVKVYMVRGLGLGIILLGAFKIATGG